MEKVFCSECGKECTPIKLGLENVSGTGYGISPTTGEKICYACCGKRDERELMGLQLGEKIVLYLHKDKVSGGWHVTNWPGTLNYRVWVKEGRHNIARVRRDVWFSVRGHNFHGTQYGDSSELCYIKRVKTY